MKAAPLLVAWHNDSSPIYSVQFEPNGKGRLATAGGDNNVRVREASKIPVWLVAYAAEIALETQ